MKFFPDRPDLLHLLEGRRARRAILCTAVLLPLTVALFFGAARFRLQQWRIRGMEAAERGRPAAALQWLGRFLQKNPRDADALIHYARCREQVPTPNQDHLKTAADAYQAASELAPNQFEPWIGLARIQAVLGNDEATLKAAIQAQRLDPEDHDALGLLVSAQIRKGAHAQLSKFAEQHASAPSWKLRLLSHDARLALGESPSALLEDELQPLENDMDAANALLLARLHALDGNRAAAVQLLEQGLQDFPHDLQFLRTITRLTTDLQAESLGMAYLDRSPACLSDPYLGLWHARRNWEQGRAQEVVDTLATGNRRTLVTQPEASLLLCMALHSLDRHRELEALLDELALEADLSKSARRWFDLLHLVVSADDIDNRQFAELTQRVLEVSPASPIVRLMHASAFYRQGEYALTARLTADALRLAPNWLQLWQLHLASLVSSGQPGRATAIAELMEEKFPANFDACLSAQLLRAAGLTREDTVQAKQLLAWSSAVRLSERDVRVQALALVRLFALRSLLERDAAAELRQAHFSEYAELTPARLLQYVVAKNYYHLAAGTTASQAPVAFTDRSQLEQRDQASSDAGRAGPRFDKGKIQTDSVEDILSSAQVSPSATLIQQLKAQSPEGAVAWRLLEARRLLVIGTDREAAAAVNTLRPVLAQLPDDPDARLLMGLALVRLEDRRAAVEHWFRASQTSVKLAEQCLRLSLAVRTENHWDDARSLVSFWVTVAASIESKTRAKSGSVEEYLLMLSAYAEETQDVALAEESYRALLRRDARHHLALNNLAFLLLRRGKSLDEAHALSKAALQLLPEHPEYRHTYAEIERALQLSTVSADTQAANPKGD